MAAGARPTSLPNLLLIVTDQQQRGTLAAYGNNRIRMPHLNRLAAQSTVFARAYCSQPVCGPARSTLFTGTYPHWNGQVTLDADPMRADVPFLTDLIDDRWCRGFFGRTGHHRYPDGAAPRPETLDEVELSTLPPAAWLRARGIEPLHGNAFTKADRPRFPEQYGHPAYLAGQACDFVARRARRPFALVVSMYEPHDPLAGPLDELHSPDEVPLPANFRPPAADQPRKALLEHLHIVNCGKDGVTITGEDSWRTLIGRYWGLCTQVDRAVGRILAALEEHGVAEETLVVFTSDHGEMAGGHQLFGKNVMFEESIGVPLLVRLPGQRAAARFDAPVSHANLVPTVLDVLGLPLPSHLQAPSLLPRLQGRAVAPAASGLETVGRVRAPGLAEASASPPASAPPQAAFVQWTGINYLVHGDLQRDPLPDWLAAVTERAAGLRDLADCVRCVVTADGWKLCWSGAGQHELYDLDRDPGEQHNLAFLAAHGQRLLELAARIVAWQRQTGDPLQLPSIGQ